MINDGLPNVLRKMIAQTVDGMSLSNFVLGVVVAESPLQIEVGGNTLDSDFLILSDNVRDYAVDIEVNHVTENRAGGSGDPAFASHNHDYRGRKKIIVYNGLKVGEKVVMFQQAGGQLFYVANRVFEHADVHGQWG
ncbi:DUF2577 domain-containing protein [Selenomonas artemidis]|uniref:DUF2577 domain-containing protein n=1 Tax=Selenomonas artemidis TaxID=671224 RepID=UPI00288A4226|nr:DUF2577 domain-containing protein [Selenomonas artemidis]